MISISIVKSSLFCSCVPFDFGFVHIPCTFYTVVSESVHSPSDESSESCKISLNAHTIHTRWISFETKKKKQIIFIYFPFSLVICLVFLFAFSIFFFFLLFRFVFLCLLSSFTWIFYRYYCVYVVYTAEQCTQK